MREACTLGGLWTTSAQESRIVQRKNGSEGKSLEGREEETDWQISGLFIIIVFLALGYLPLT